MYTKSHRLKGGLWNCNSYECYGYGNCKVISVSFGITYINIFLELLLSILNEILIKIQKSLGSVMFRTGSSIRSETITVILGHVSCIVDISSLLCFACDGQKKFVGNFGLNHRREKILSRLREILKKVARSLYTQWIEHCWLLASKNEENGSIFTIIMAWTDPKNEKNISNA